MDVFEEKILHFFGMNYEYGLVLLNYTSGSF